MIDNKVLQVSFLNVLYCLDLEYNLFSIGTIEKADDSVLGKNGEIPVFDNKDNVAFVTTQIETG